MPWKNKHQKRQQKSNSSVKHQQQITHQNGSRVPMVSVTPAAPQQQIPARGAGGGEGNTHHRSRNGDNGQANVRYITTPHDAHPYHGNISSAQQRGVKVMPHLDQQPQQQVRKGNRPASPRRHSNKVSSSRQDVRVSQHHMNGGVSPMTAKEMYMQAQRHEQPQHRRSASQGRDSEVAYLRQMEYQQHQQQSQQAPPRPSRFRDAQMRHSEYQQQQHQRQRSLSPQKDLQQRSLSLQRDLQPPPQQQRPLSPSRRREEQLRHIEYERQLRKRQEQQPNGGARPEGDPRRVPSPRNRNSIDGMKSGGTLTKEQRRLVIQQQRSIKAAKDKQQMQQHDPNSRGGSSNGNVVRIPRENAQQFLDPRYLQRGQRSHSQQQQRGREPQREPSPQERPKTSMDDRGRRENGHQQPPYASRTASLDRNMRIQEMMHDPNWQNMIAQNGDHERISRQQMHQPTRGSEGGIPVDMLKTIQHRISSRRSKSPGAVETEKQRLIEDLRRNANHQSGIQLVHSSRPPGEDRQQQQAGQSSSSPPNRESRDFAVSMANQGMTVVTIPYPTNAVLHVDVHQEEVYTSQGTTGLSSEANVPQLISYDTRGNETSPPIVPARPSRRRGRAAADADNSSSPRDGNNRPPSSLEFPIPLPRKSRSRSRNRSPDDSNDPESPPQHPSAGKQDVPMEGSAFVTPTKETQNMNYAMKYGVKVSPIQVSEQTMELQSSSPRTDDSEDPVPKPRRPKASRSPRSPDVSEKETIRLSETDQLAAIRNGVINDKKSSLPRGSPRRGGASQDSQPHVLPSKILFHKRRHSMGLDNRLSKHPDPTTLPEQIALDHQKRNDAVVTMRYEKTISVTGLRNSTKEKSPSESTGSSPLHIVNGVPETVSSMVTAKVVNNEQKDHVLLQDPVSKNNVNDNHLPAKAVLGTITMDDDDGSSLDKGHEHVAEETRDEKLDDNDQKKENYKEAGVDMVDGADSSTQQTSVDEGANPNESLPTDVKEPVEDDLPPTLDSLNRSNSELSKCSSSIQLMSNSSFTSKSSNEHELTDSLSDSTGSHVLSPLAEGGFHVSPPVPPPRFRKRTMRESHRTSSDASSNDMDTGDERGVRFGETKGLGQYPYVKKNSITGERGRLYSKEHIGSVATINTVS